MQTKSMLFAAVLGLCAGTALAQSDARQWWDRLTGRPAGSALQGSTAPLPTGAKSQIVERTDTQPFARSSAVVFIGPNCPQCDQAVRFAREAARLPVEVLDVSSGGVVAQQFAGLRVNGLPATVAGTQVLLGADSVGARTVLARAGMDKSDSNPP